MSKYMDDNLEVKKFQAEIEIPEGLYRMIIKLVDKGIFESEEEFILESIRKNIPNYQIFLSKKKKK